MYADLVLVHHLGCLGFDSLLYSNFCKQIANFISYNLFIFKFQCLMDCVSDSSCYVDVIGVVPYLFSDVGLIISLRS
jgi:hypothetical protein